MCDKGSDKSSYLRTSYCLSWGHVGDELYPLGYTEGCVSFLPLLSLSRLPVRSITFWLNPYSVIKRFPFLTTFVEMF